jgi:hypothetical protein
VPENPPGRHAQCGQLSPSVLSVQRTQVRSAIAPLIAFCRLPRPSCLVTVPPSCSACRVPASPAETHLPHGPLTHRDVSHTEPLEKKKNPKERTTQSPRALCGLAVAPCGPRVGYSQGIVVPSAGASESACMHRAESTSLPHRGGETLLVVRTIAVLSGSYPPSHLCCGGCCHRCHRCLSPLSSRVSWSQPEARASHLRMRGQCVLQPVGAALLRVSIRALRICFPKPRMQPLA